MRATIYRNGWQAKKVLAITWFLAAIAAVCVLTALGLSANGMTVEGLMVVAAGVPPFAGMLFYCSIYAKEIRIADDTLEIDVLTMLGRRTLRMPLAAVRRSGEKRGRMVSARGQYIDTPWLNLSVPNRRIPFLIDLQAEEVDLPAFSQFGTK